MPQPGVSSSLPLTPLFFPPFPAPFPLHHQHQLICSTDSPNQSCAAAAVATVSPPCEAYSDKATKTSCICSTLSLVASCYESLCPRDNLNDVYDTYFNSLSCPNAPVLTVGQYATKTGGAATTTTAGGGAATGGTATTGSGAVNTGTGSGSGSGKSSGAGGRGVMMGGDLVVAAVGGVLGGVALLGALL